MKTTYTLQYAWSTKMRAHTQSQTQTPICFQGFCTDTYICQWGRQQDPWLQSPCSSAAGSTRRAGCLGQTRTGRTAQSPPPFELHQPSAAHTAQEETNGECLQGHLQNTAGAGRSLREQLSERRDLGKWGIVMRELSTPKWLRKMVVWKLLSCPLAFQIVLTLWAIPFCPLGTLHSSYLTFLSLSLFLCFSVSPPLSHLQKFLFSLAPSSEPSIRSLAF